MSEDNQATQSGGQAQSGSAPNPGGQQGPQTRTYTPEEVNQIVAQRVGQVVRERNQLRQQVQQFQTSQYQQPDRGASASTGDDGEDDEKFFRGIVQDEVSKVIQPIKQDFQRTRAREELSTYFSSKGTVPEDVRQEIEQTYLDIVDQGYNDQVSLQDVVRGVIGARMEQDFFNRQSTAQTVNSDVEAASRSAQAEGSNTAPPNTEARDFNALSLEEMEKELEEKGFNLGE